MNATLNNQANITGRIETINGKPVYIQHIANPSANVRITKYQVGEPRVAKIRYANGDMVVVPTELLACMAGNDFWMRDIQMKCPDCGNRFKASDMEGDFCQDCYAKDIS